MYDFKTKEGCIEFVSAEVLPQVEKAFSIYQRCNKFGLAFATQIQGRELPQAHPVLMALGPFNTRDARRRMTKMATETLALGAVYVRQDEFQNQAKDLQMAVVVQLEHKSFRDQTWTAYVTSSRKLEAWIGPLELRETPIQVKELRFLATRWMS